MTLLIRQHSGLVQRGAILGNHAQVGALAFRQGVGFFASFCSPPNLKASEGSFTAFAVAPASTRHPQGSA